MLRILILQVSQSAPHFKIMCIIPWRDWRVIISENDEDEMKCNVVDFGLPACT